MAANTWKNGKLWYLLRSILYYPAGQKFDRNLSISYGFQDICDFQNRLFFDPSLTHMGGRGAKLTSYLDSPHMVSQYLPIYFAALNPIIKEILSKNPKLATYDPSLSPKRGSGGNLTGCFNSPHMVSQYLPIHFVALNPIIKEILSKNPKLAS